ncbi:MAG: hypothetical protein RR988_04175 [Clostridia bacterium]
MEKYLNLFIKFNMSYAELAVKLFGRNKNTKAATDKEFIGILRRATKFYEPINDIIFFYNYYKKELDLDKFNSILSKVSVKVVREDRKRVITKQVNSIIMLDDCDYTKSVFTIYEIMHQLSNEDKQKLLDYMKYFEITDQTRPIRDHQGYAYGYRCLVSSSNLSLNTLVDYLDFYLERYPIMEEYMVDISQDARIVISNNRK